MKVSLNSRRVDGKQELDGWRTVCMYVYDGVSQRCDTAVSRIVSQVSSLSRDIHTLLGQSQVTRK